MVGVKISDSKPYDATGVVSVVSSTAVEGDRVLICVRRVFTTVALVSLVMSFAVFWYIQFQEITQLKERVASLERAAIFEHQLHIADDMYSSGGGSIRAARQAPVQDCCSSLARPEVSGNSTEIVFAYGGQTVLLPCSGSGTPAPSVTFTPSRDPTGNGRYIMTGAGLTINNVQTSDAGIYSCSLKNVFGTDSKLVELRITDPVVATTSSNTLTAAVGGSLSINCDVSGVPTPTVTWEHIRVDGLREMITNFTTSSNGRYTLTFNNVHHENAGTYICHAANQYETDQAQTVVKITGVPQILNPPHNQNVLEGDTVTLRCDTISDPPATVTWTFPLTGQQAPLNARLNPDGSVTLSIVDHFNSGTYTCMASNGVGSSSASATLAVEQKVTVTAGPHLVAMTGSESFIRFQCSALGDPKPTVTWSKYGAGSLAGNSKYIQLPGGNLVITGASVSTDTGVYECKGENHIGTKTDTVLVYRDMGPLSCQQTYADVDCPMSVTCGGTCGDCSQVMVSIYGNETYSHDSAICRSALHAGTLPNALGVALWTSTGSTTNLPAVSRNGVTSEFKPTTSSTATMIRPASYSTAAVGAANLVG